MSRIGPLADGAVAGGNMARYPNPYYDLAQFALPSTVKELMVLSRRLFLTDSVMHPAIWKISNYPITDIRYDGPTPAVRMDAQNVGNHVLRLKQFNQLLNLDFNVYGNGMASWVHPFDKWLICPRCNFERLAKHTQYDFNRHGETEYSGMCRRCKKTVVYVVQDRYLRRAWNRLRLIRWPPISIDIIANPYTGDAWYFHRIPDVIKRMVRNAVPLITATMPIDFIKCALANRRIKLTSDNFFHMARPSISDTEMTVGKWGIPITLPAVRSSYVRRILVRAQEAMAQGRILPLRVLWPSQGNQPAPVGGIGLGGWRVNLENEVRLWTRDPNYISISPVPLAMGTVGADARPMLLGQEIQMIGDECISAMNIPTGLVRGDLNYTGASISLRIMENEAISNRVLLHDFNNGFVMNHLQNYMDWPKCLATFTPMRSADDVQRQQLLFQGVQMGHFPRKTFYGEMGYDTEYMKKQHRLEVHEDIEIAQMQAVSQAEAQGQSQLIAARYQAEIQKIMMAGQQPSPDSVQAAQMDPWSIPEPAGPEEGAQPSEAPTQAEMINQHLGELGMMDPEERTAQMQAIGQTNPGYAAELDKLMGNTPQSRGGTINTGAVNMTPLPPQRPPTRNAAII